MSAPRIAVRAVQPAIRTCFSSGTFAHVCAKNGHKWPQTRPNGRRRMRGGVLRCPIYVPCAPNGPRSVAERAIEGAVLFVDFREALVASPVHRQVGWI